jgi:hypothetical protein
LFLEFFVGIVFSVLLVVFASTSQQLNGKPYGKTGVSAGSVGR